MPIWKFTSNPQPEPLLRPAEGYPYWEPGLRDWSCRNYAREATERELGSLMAAMGTQAEKAGPGEARVEPGGWQVKPNATLDPASKRRPG